MVKFNNPFKTEAINQSVKNASSVLKGLPKGFKNWFQVDEAQISDVLRQIRESLPTTEVILLGKPQSGKSSMIRALTGATEDIIGQGFRPHTTHTQTYVYPTEDLPLLVFTDTVGLGDGMEDPEAVTQELMSLVKDGAQANDAKAPAQQAKIII